MELWIPRGSQLSDGSFNCSPKWRTYLSGAILSQLSVPDRYITETQSGILSAGKVALDKLSMGGISA